MARKEYRYVATSKAGFIRQLVNYARHGYVFYVKGHVRKGLDPERVDDKLLGLYDVRKTDAQRHWRKKNGNCNFQYLRFERTWVLLLTPGEQPAEFMKRERNNIRNLERGEPLAVCGYSICRVMGDFIRNRDKPEDTTGAVRDTKRRVRVQISKSEFKELKGEFLRHARTRSEDWYRLKFYHSGFEPYAPIRKQLLDLLRMVNAARAPHGLPKIKPDCIRYRIEPVKVFEAVSEAGKQAA
ncbi:hypothetical protein [Rubripirellula reticaptiva]|uniref:Uncharacterized protein n=1 Tax=Rubripirellula reticaptiva TaxID=2528013 RepID=A0A5C6EM12_9BACT|nr:hypothetical protein [Rubripirellula reticaptiva]TWU49430.1 hypothetical protein Poly59_40450 [Rubripirellula reticaptiva]